MCFIKELAAGQLPIYYPRGNNCQCSTIFQTPKNAISPFYSFPFLWPNQNPQNACVTNRIYQQLQVVQNLIKSNNQLICASFQNLEKNQNQLYNLDQEINEIGKQGFSPTSFKEEEEIKRYIQQAPTFHSHSFIIQKIFGRKTYRFKIKAVKGIPKIIFKERNLHIPLQLVTSYGKLVKNSNLIHLCIAICDQKGKWVVDQNDQFFIKGKIEVELYRGECEFRKISPKDISKHFPGGKVNIVVYAKPSILVPTESLAKGEFVIDCAEIQPIVFSSILIRAKKCRY